MMGAKWRGDFDKGDDKGRGKGRGMEACPGPRSRGSLPRFLFFRLSPVAGQGSMNVKMSDERFCIAACEHCGQRIEFPAHGVGMKVACPHCARELVLAGEVASASAKPEEITAGELKAALAGPVPRQRISVLYQAGLLLVACFMVLLPLAYFGLAVLTGYGVYRYAVNAKEMFFSLGGNVYLLLLEVILYVGPIVPGRGGGPFHVQTDPGAQPQTRATHRVESGPASAIYQFIAHLSDLLRISIPKRIYLSCDLNAGAGFERGWLSLLRNDVSLTLGLPLVAGLNTRQLAAVVAHELGHGTQALAMRLSSSFFASIAGLRAWCMNATPGTRHSTNGPETSKTGGCPWWWPA